MLFYFNQSILPFAMFVLCLPYVCADSGTVKVLIIVISTFSLFEYLLIAFKRNSCIKYVFLKHKFQCRQEGRWLVGRQVRLPQDVFELKYKMETNPQVGHPHFPFRDFFPALDFHFRETEFPSNRTSGSNLEQRRSGKLASHLPKDRSGPSCSLSST